MTHIVNEVTAYDRKRWKVTLDEGALTFLLYTGELKSLGIERSEGTENRALSEDQLNSFLTGILLPRAKKRALYYLKGGDKTEFQIKSKLKESFYPEEIISEVITFLRKYRLADDARYAENYVEEMKGSRSRREMEAKLYAKGLKGEQVKQLLSEVPKDAEYSACEKALRKHPPKDKKKDAAYLMRKGFSWDAIEHALCACSAAYEPEGTDPQDLSS